MSQRAVPPGPEPGGGPVQEITPDTLTAGYPGLGQSVAQVIHNTDERCKSLQ